MPEKVHTYENEEIIIHWNPTQCAHSTLCWKGLNGLPEVFNPSARPWINPSGASVKEIIQRIDACPSGALSYTMKDTINTPEPAQPEALHIEVKPGGPLLIRGKINILHQGVSLERDKVTALCRCGASKNKPYCDGSHNQIQFDESCT